MFSQLFNKIANKAITGVLAVFPFLLQSCFGYKIEGDKVFYEDWRSGSGVSIELAGKPDIDSFKKINSQFAKDKNHVWFNEWLITDADPKTFKVIDGVYSKDKQHAFVGNSTIEGADPNTFELTEFKNITKDKNHVFDDGKVIPQAIPRSFLVLEDRSYAKDEAHVYHKPRKKDDYDVPNYALIESAHAPSFYVNQELNV